jgi:hypothetical protein
VLIFARGRVVKTLTGTEITKGSIAEECLRSSSVAIDVSQVAQQKVLTA